MSELLIDDLDDGVRSRLEELARLHGRTVADEARDILRDAVTSAVPTVDPNEGLGTRITRRFAGLGLRQDIPEWRGYPADPPTLGP